MLADFNDVLLQTGTTFPILLALLFSAFAMGVLHGATGMAGGVALAAILAHILGIKEAVAIMSCALIFSHGSRVLLMWRNADWSIVGTVLLFGSPMIVIGAWIFTYLDPRVVAAIFAIFLTVSFPIKRWAKQRQLVTGPKLLAGASMVWGLLAGNVIGPGFFLAPFLLGTGMNRLTFVGSLAVIVLVMNAIKLLVFGSTELMTTPLFVLGVAIGLATIPGNWLGKRILHRISDQSHHRIVDVLTVLMILNFAYLALFDS